MLLELPVGVVVVDRRYTIRSINTSAREMLGIYGTAVGQDLVHLSQNVQGRELRNAIEDHFRTGETTVIPQISVTETSSDAERHLRILCSSRKSSSQSAGNEEATIVVIDLTDQVRTRQESEQQARELESKLEKATEMLERSRLSNRDLLHANQEVTQANLELRESNENFLVGNEELQAATEEVETLNEELQATNEELETLNEELNSTVEELNTTNEDLRARSIELEALAASLDTERRATEIERTRLAAILESMGDSVAVIDAQGQIIRTNPAYDREFGSPPIVARDNEDHLIDPRTARLPGPRKANSSAWSLRFTRETMAALSMRLMPHP